jgi:hypothetical protein
MLPGELLPEQCFVIKIHNEGFIFRIAFPDKSKSRDVDALPLVAHAAAVVDNEAKAQRNIVVCENIDLLQHIVFVYLEARLREIVERLSVFGRNGHRDEYAPDVLRQGERSIVR